MNFKQFLLEQSFSDLNQWLQQHNTTIQQVVQKLQQKPPDGKGGNADFWAIPNSPFGIRVPRGKVSQNAVLLNPGDTHPDMNFGQPIGNYGHIQILKLQSGNPAGMEHGSHNFAPDAQSKAIQNYKNRLEDAAKLPQESYDKLVKQFQYLNEKGYRIDPSKPGNLLIDPIKGFNLVDIAKSSEGQKNSPNEIIVMLLDNFNFNKYNLNQDPKYQELAKIIIKKTQIAANNSKIEFGKSGSSDYSMKLAGIT